MIPLSAHLGYLFNELPLEERFAATAKAGFSLVEHPSPYAMPAEQVAELCAQNGLKFIQFALPAGDPAQAEKGIACLPGRENEFRDSIRTGLDYARALDCPFVHVMAGIRPVDQPFERVWRTYVGNLKQACSIAQDCGRRVLIEPIGSGTIEGYLVDEPEIAMRAIREVSAPNLHMLLDTFHTANSGLDPLAIYLACKKHVAHLHFADFPGRHEPGTGTIDFQKLIRMLLDNKYLGAIGLEYLPRASTSAGLGWPLNYDFDPPT